MDFFDKIGSTITSASQGVTAQTKNLSELAKVNLEISSNEKVINELYISIGRTFYDAHKESEECFAKESVDQINQLMYKNSQLKATVKELKGLTTCKHCGQEVSNKSAFCSVCGKPFEKNVPAGTCVNCGNPVGAEDKFCLNCGTPVAAPAVAPVEEPVAEPVVCPSCSAMVEPGMKFCNKCGTKVM